jgi:hypothetical protein
MMSDKDWLKSGFSTIWPVHVEAFAQFLIALRRDFGGDLDMALILAVIGERRYARRTSREVPTYERLGATDGRVTGTVSINSYSIAEYTGIPRETVRRKVTALIDHGWIERGALGDLIPTMKAASDLANSTEATLTYLSTVIAACDRVRKSAPSAPKA